MIKAVLHFLRMPSYVWVELSNWSDWINKGNL